MGLFFKYIYKNTFIKMYSLIRKHLLPQGVDKKVIYDHYIDSMKNSRTLMASWDMNFWIKKKYSFRSSVLKEAFILIEFDSYRDYINSIKHDTIVQQWMENKRGVEKQICFKKTRKKTKCSICLDTTGIFVSVHPCNCLFHRQCIMEASRYSMLCPLCKNPIKENSNKTNAEKAKKT